jgi:hypothetical protein
MRFAYEFSSSTGHSNYYKLIEGRVGRFVRMYDRCPLVQVRAVSFTPNFKVLVNANDMHGILSHLTALSSLDLHNVNILPIHLVEVARALASAPALSTLSIPADDEVLIALACSPTLSSLRIYEPHHGYFATGSGYEYHPRIDATGSGYKAICTMRALTHLDVSYSPDLSRADLSLFGGISTLSHLNLTGVA